VTSDAPRRFLDVLDEGARADLGRRSVVRSWRAGSTLVRESDHAGRVLVVQTGRVKVSVITVDGNEVVLAIRGPGELVGELSAVDGRPHGSTATAMDDVTCLVIDNEEFGTFLRRYPEAAMAVIQLLAFRLRDADTKRVEFGAYDSVGRVARRLVELADEHGRRSADGVRIMAGLTQSELAGFTGSSREAVSRALRILRDEGLITTHRRGITVHDVDALRSRA
jgi:CRP/FNR family cyclic AMP-dependent transcriptional regulator